MKRLKVTDDEAELIKGFRQQRAIWNEAIEAAAMELVTVPDSELNRATVTAAILRLRKEGLP